MPKQRGGWKGSKPPGGKPRTAAPAEDADSADEMLYDEVDRFHRRDKPQGGKAGSKSLSFNLGDGAHSDEDDDDYDEEAPVMGLDDDGDAAPEDDDEDDEDDEDAAAARSAAQKKEDALLTAWGRDKSAFYSGDADVEIDDEAAKAEEEEALRLQRARAAALDDGDAALGLAVVGGASGKKSKGAAAGASSSGVERVAKKLDGLSRQQRLEVALADTPELLGLLAELREKAAELRRVLAPAIAAAPPGSAGLSYLNVKRQLLLSYLSQLTFYLLLRAEGRPVASHPVVAELVRSRALLERLRPLDARMAPTIARLLRAASSASSAAAHAGGDDDDGEDLEAELAAAAAASGAGARPNPAALLAHGEEARAVGKGKGKAAASAADEKKGKKTAAAAGGDSDEDGAGDAGEGEGGKYVPLRRVAVRYDEDGQEGGAAAARAAREAARAKQRLERSGLLADLRAAYSEAPEEDDAGGGGAGADDAAGRRADAAIAARAAERAAAEEDAFARLQPGREERQALKARKREKERARWDALAELEHYGDLAAAGLEGNGGDDDDDDVGAGAGGRAGKRGAADAQALARLNAAVGAGSARALTGSKRRHPDGHDDDDGGSSDGGGGGAEDPFYAAVAAAAARKKAKREARAAAAAEESAQRIRAIPDEDALDEDDTGGHRKASKTILANRGLVKYRRKDDKNPRTNYRRKAELAVKRRKGQVRSMRDTGAEAGRYGGESTGIRAAVTHSRKIRA